MQHHREFIEQLVARGGPRPDEYAALDEWVRRVYGQFIRGAISEPEVADLRKCFGDALSPSTMFGFALRKPHGYAGDFEIMDRAYQQRIADEPHLAAWDHYFHQQPAPTGIRNRKAYFHRVLDLHDARRTPIRVLNVASGPGRCMFEWLSKNPDAAVTFQCIEIDPAAIAYASELNSAFLDRVTFRRMNALKFEPVERFDLIWAAGIFDYFIDAAFQSLAGRLIKSLAPGGELVIGNLAEGNPSRAHMELLCDWPLHHRSAQRLVDLARGLGVDSDLIRMGAEAQGVNLFLHINAAK